MTTPTGAKCHACSKDFWGGVGVDAYDDSAGERIVWWYCSKDCAVSFVFAAAIREAHDETNYYRDHRDRLQAEVRQLQNERNGRKRR